MTLLWVFDGSGQNQERWVSAAWAGWERVNLFALTSRAEVVRQAAAVAEQHGLAAAVVPAADQLEKSTEEMRAWYLELVASLPERIAAEAGGARAWLGIDGNLSQWWLSLVQEKNTFKSDAFNYLVQAAAVIGELRAGRYSAVCYSGASPALAEVIAGYARRHGLAVIGRPDRPAVRPPARLRLLLWHLRRAGRTALDDWRLGRRYRRRLRRLPRQKPRDGELVIVTYYPFYDPAAAAAGTFRNNYYLPLQEALSAEGRPVTWLAITVRHNQIAPAAALAAAERFAAQGTRLFFLEEGLTLPLAVKTVARVIRSGWRFWRREREIAAVYEQDGWNAYPLFREEWYKSTAGPVAYFGLRSYCLFQQWFTGWRQGRCLYPCEHHAWEKAMLAARPAVGSEVRCYGYQSGTVSKNLLNFHSLPRELDQRVKYPIPLPDMLICNGEAARNSFREAQWPPERLAMAEAIRYYHLRRPLATAIPPRPPRVLVALSINPAESAALLAAALAGLGNLAGGEVVVKPHPSLELAAVLPRLGLTPEQFDLPVTHQPMTELLPLVKVVVAGESSVSIEALAYGCRVIMIRLPEFITMSPLAGTVSDLVAGVDSPAALRELAGRWATGAEPTAAQRRAAAEIVHSYFLMPPDADRPELLLQLIGETGEPGRLRAGQNAQEKKP